MTMITFEALTGRHQQSKCENLARSRTTTDSCHIRMSKLTYRVNTPCSNVRIRKFPYGHTRNRKVPPLKTALNINHLSRLSINIEMLQSIFRSQKPQI